MSPDRRNPFAEYRLARAAERRDESRWLSRALNDPRTRFVVVEDQRSLFNADDELVLPSPDHPATPSELGRLPGGHAVG